MIKRMLMLILAVGAGVNAEPLAQKGFRHFYNLEYDEAITAFRLEVASNGSNASAYNHLAQAVLYRGLYRSGLLEDSLTTGDDFLVSLIRQPKLSLSQEDDAQFADAIGKSINLAQNRIDQNPNDADAMFALGAAYGLRANYKFLVQKSWLSAMRDSNTGRKLHNRVLTVDPSRTDAKMMQGLHDYVVASLPGGFRFLSAIVGIRGDKERGLLTLAEVADQGSTNRIDAQILLTTLYRHEKRFSPALGILPGLEASYPGNYLFPLARIYTQLDAGDAPGAASALNQMREAAKTKLAGYRDLRRDKLEFTEGVIRMSSHDLDGAVRLFSELANQREGVQPTTQLRALVRLGQAYDLRGQRSLARQAYQEVVAHAPDTRCARASQQFLNKPFHGTEGD